VYKHVVALRSQELALTIGPHRRPLSIVLSLVILAATAWAAGCSSGGAAGSTRITLGFSAWPGWLPWQVAQAEGLFAQHGLNVDLKYFDNYTDSLLALETGALDANSQTLGDTLLSVSAGAKQRIVLVNDNSTGNDKIIARDGIISVSDLVGKRIAVEQGTVDHYLLLLALAQAGLSQNDVSLDPLSREAAAAAFAAGKDDVVCVSAPFTTKALQRPGSHAISTSAEFPGAIPTDLVVRPDLVKEHPQVVQALIDTWFDTLRWIKGHRDAAIDIMARQARVSVDDYRTYDAGTTIFTRQQNLDAFTPGTTPQHLNYQAALTADFVFGTGMVQHRPGLDGLLDDHFVKEAA
jgi:NitT/TauT family transport system substrate-binding protein